MPTFGGETAESYYDEGVTAQMKGDISLAIKHFERAAQLDRTYVAAYHQLGKCYLRLGDTEKAVKLLRDVLAVKPRIVAARVDLGMAYVDAKQTDEAVHVFNEVLSLKPNQARAQLGLAQCQYEKGNWLEASGYAQQAIANGGANFSACFLLARAARKEGDPETAAENFERADAIMKKSIETSPDNPEGYYLRGEVAFAQDQISQALDHYTAACDRAIAGKHYAAYGERFTRAGVLLKRAACLQAMGNQLGAESAAKEALALEPDNAAAKAFLQG